MWDFQVGATRPSRQEVLSRFLATVDPQAAVVATTGMTGRELFALEDRVQQLYLVGAMGAASGMALGISLNSEKPIIVLDGDGAALMKLGTLATIGARRPGNLTHILLDNGVHDSTGGQATVSASVDFAALAQAAHYPMAYRCDSISGFVKALSECTGQPGPHFAAVCVLTLETRGFGTRSGLR